MLLKIGILSQLGDLELSLQQKKPHKQNSSHNQTPHVPLSNSFMHSLMNHWMPDTILVYIKDWGNTANGMLSPQVGHLKKGEWKRDAESLEIFQCFLEHFLWQVSQCFLFPSSFYWLYLVIYWFTWKLCNSFPHDSPSRVKLNIIHLLKNVSEHLLYVSHILGIQGPRLKLLMGPSGIYK